MTDDKDSTNHSDLLGRDEILTADDIQYEIVEVPEWSRPGSKLAARVRVKALAAIERDDFERSLIIVSADGKKTRNDFSNMRAKLCSRAIVDKNGKRIFQDSDVLALGAKSAAALDRVFEVASRLAKISKEDIEEAKGNSAGDPSDASLSGSP